MAKAIPQSFWCVSLRVLSQGALLRLQKAITHVWLTNRNDEIRLSRFELNVNIRT